MKRRKKRRGIFFGLKVNACRSLWFYSFSTYLLLCGTKCLLIRTKTCVTSQLTNVCENRTLSKRIVKNEVGLKGWK